MASEERNRILRLVEAGQITAAEAAQLLDLLEAAPEEPPASEQRRHGRLLHIRVMDLVPGRPRVSVTVPIDLIDVGLRLATRLAPQIRGSALEQLLCAIQQATTGRLLDFQDLEENERVEMFIE